MLRKSWVKSSLGVFGQVNHFDPSPLHRQQLLDVVNAKASQTVFVFDDDEGDGWIGEEFQQLGPPIIDTQANLFQDGHQAIAFGGAVVPQTLGLPFQVIFIFGSGQTGVDGNFLIGDGCEHLRDRIGDDDRTSVNLIASQSSGFEPAPGRVVGDSGFAGVGAQFHNASIEHLFVFVNRHPQNEDSYSILERSIVL